MRTAAWVVILVTIVAGAAVTGAAGFVWYEVRAYQTDAEQDRRASEEEHRRHKDLMRNLGR